MYLNVAIYGYKAKNTDLFAAFPFLPQQIFSRSIAGKPGFKRYMNS